MSEFIFQAVSLIVGIVAIIFAFLIGFPAYQKISDTTNTEIELIREIGMLNNINIFDISCNFKYSTPVFQMETGKNRWQTIKNNWGDLIESALNTPRENPK